MARYGRFEYYPDSDERATEYGAAGIEAFSVQPFFAEVIDYDKVNLHWTNPDGDILRLRLVRNQEGVPDTSEDGIILLDVPFREVEAGTTQSHTDEGITATGELVPLIPGRHVYYSIWLWLGSPSLYRWQLAATLTETIPSPHATTSATGEITTTHTRLLNSLPRVFTSDELNVLGEVNYSSDLSRFLEGITFTADQIMTLADLLAPSPGLVNLTPELLNSYALNFGIKPENKNERRPTKFQRKLVSNALSLYMSKGKTDSLEALVESLTGYQVYAVESGNLMLSAQDATFYGGVGNWVAETGCTLSSITGTAPSSSEITSNEFAYRVDGTRIAQVVVSSATNLLTNGKDNPVLKGIPVRELSPYAFALYQKKSSTVTTEEITLTVEWHDYTGRVIPDSEYTQTFDVTAAWSKVSLEYAQSPEKAAYASLSVEFSATGTYLLDMVQFSDYSEENFTEARGVGVALSPSKRNYITNPSFEGSTTGWSDVNATLTSVAFDLGTEGLPGDEIPGQYSGDDFLNVASVEDDEVAVMTTAAEVITGSGDVTFSAHTYSVTAPTAGIEVTLEAYAAAPYVNYVTVPTPTAAPTTGWSYTGGTFTTSFPTTGGPTGNPTRVLLTYSSAQTTGDVVIAVANTGLTIDWDEILADAEYTFAVWVKPNAATTAVPTITWTLADDPDISGDVPTVPPSVGDEVSLSADEWTRVEFTVQAPYGIASAALSLDVSRVGITTLAIADAQFFPVTYTSTGVIGTASGEWERGSVTLAIPSDALFPDGVRGLSVDVTLRYVSTGDAVRIDAVQLEDGYRQTDYFDGSFPYAYWGGTDHQSPSSLYANLDQKLSRVQQKLRTYLPLGTPYYVETSNGVEFGGSFKGYA